MNSHPTPTRPSLPRRAAWVVGIVAALAGVIAATQVLDRGASPVAGGPDAARLLAWQEEVARVRQARAQRLLDRLYPGQALVTVSVELAATVTDAEERIAADWPAVRSRTTVEERDAGEGGRRHDTRSSEYEPFVGTRRTTALAPAIRSLHAVLVLDPSLAVDTRRQREIVDAVKGAIGTADDGTVQMEVLIEPLVAGATSAALAGPARDPLTAWLPWLVALGAAGGAIWLARRRSMPVAATPVAEAPRPPALEPSAPLESAVAPQSAVTPDPSPEPEAVGPFDAFAPYEPRDLAAVLNDAHPQLAAVVLAHLAPARGAAVLAAMPRAVRADLVRRVASIEHLAADAVARAVDLLDQEIRRRGLAPGATATPPGASSAAAMLSQLGDLDLLREVEAEDPEAAARIRDELFTFDDLPRLDGRALQSVLGRVDARTLALALKAATAEVERCLLGNLSRRAGALVLEEREVLGPTPRREVEEAQAAVVAVVRDLLERDEISLDDRAAELL